jgi:hypothetical protein
MERVVVKIMLKIKLNFVKLDSFISSKLFFLEVQYMAISLISLQEKPQLSPLEDLAVF